jgi:hypothetical protein
VSADETYTRHNRRREQLDPECKSALTDIFELFFLARRDINLGAILNERRSHHGTKTGASAGDKGYSNAFKIVVGVAQLGIPTLPATPARVAALRSIV